MSCPIYVTKKTPIIYAMKNEKTINITAQAIINLVPTVTQFSFTATEGQTEFTLEGVPTLLHYLAINGVIQRQGTDYTIDDDVITLTEGVDAGTFVFGQYQ
jgi:hypothetical protein